MEEMKWITIYSQRLAGFLMMNGFVLQRLGVNKEDPEKKTFQFKSSDNIHSKIKEFNNK